MRALGLDVGEKRIGLAFADTEGGVAVPAGVVHRGDTPDALDEVVARAASRGVDLLVVGMPWSLDGGAGPQAEVVAEFIGKLQQRTTLTVATWDERFTSVEAERRLREVRREHRPRGKARPTRKRARGEEDALAATVMLQAYLDARDR